jgi:hypothetical protein
MILIWDRWVGRYAIPSHMLTLAYQTEKLEGSSADGRLVARSPSDAISI